MKPLRFVIVVLTAVVLAGTRATPALAQQNQPQGSRTGTVVKWALIGAATGAAIGFAAGFHAYDDARFAERKISQATLAGAAIGGGVGVAIGFGRSHARSSPSRQDPPSLWTPTMAMKRAHATDVLRVPAATALPRRVVGFPGS